jgi:hypothetical protein
VITPRKARIKTIRRYSVFTGGEWADTDERFEIRSPVTGDLVGGSAARVLLVEAGSPGRHLNVQIPAA